MMILAGCLRDPLRLVIDVSGLGLTGYEGEQILLREFHLNDEFCDRRNIVCVLGPTDTAEHLSRLEIAFKQISARYAGARALASEESLPFSVPPMSLTPREAFSRPRSRRLLRDSVGYVCAETIGMYPPGIPLICPGEIVTEDIVEQCQELAAQSVVAFAEDSTLRTIAVLDR